MSSIVTIIIWMWSGWLGMFLTRKMYNSTYYTPLTVDMIMLYAIAMLVGPFTAVVTLGTFVGWFENWLDERHVSSIRCLGYVVYSKKKE